jgi:hypothetical protein
LVTHHGMESICVLRERVPDDGPRLIESTVSASTMGQEDGLRY